MTRRLPSHGRGLVAVAGALLALIGCGESTGPVGAVAPTTTTTCEADAGQSGMPLSEDISSLSPEKQALVIEGRATATSCGLPQAADVYVEPFPDDASRPADVRRVQDEFLDKMNKNETAQLMPLDPAGQINHDPAILAPAIDHAAAVVADLWTADTRDEIVRETRDGMQSAASVSGWRPYRSIVLSVVRFQGVRFSTATDAELLALVTRTFEYPDGTTDSTPTAQYHVTMQFEDETWKLHSFSVHHCNDSGC